MADQQQQGEQTRQGEPVLDADLAQHLGLLDWSQLDPIGEGQALTGAENEAGFFDDFGDDLLEDEGVLSSHATCSHVYRRFCSCCDIYGWQSAERVSVAFPDAA